MKRLFPFILLFLGSLSIPLAAPCMDVPFSGGQTCMYFETYTPTLADTPTPTLTFTPTATQTATPSPTSTALACDETYIPIYNDAGDDFTGTISTNLTPSWSGVAATASTFTFHANLYNGRQLYLAKWMIAWTPNSATIPVRIKLVAQEPYNGYLETVLAEKIATGTTPIAQLHVFTSELQAFIDTGTQLLIGHKPVGNGSNGISVYLSALHLIWKCS
jgi:hypothetical protein